MIVASLTLSAGDMKLTPRDTIPKGHDGIIRTRCNGMV